ncbi:MAG TPA: urease accessory protein UreH [Methylomirabilota bacterium]|jgi:high-affinity nickel permease|nr:urease accessory protein UreH [Methylomirabilota bacterium]
MDVSLVTALGLGLTLGLRHALDADHVAAVSTLVARERGLARSCLLGAFWGAGHTLALLGAGIAVVGFKLTITPGLEAALERAVGLVLVVLAGHVLLRALGGMLVHGHEHAHGGVTHRHAHAHLGSPDAGHVHLVRLGGRPFLVGLLHGLAGSAALTLLVLGTISSPIGALVYILVFGVGSTAGMLLLSGLVGLPVALLAPGAHRLRAAIQVVAGAGSAALGIWMLAGPPA